MEDNTLTHVTVDLGVAMARRGRPASESYQPFSCSSNQLVSFSTEASAVRVEAEVDQAPIFSLSKSSMDVVLATGRPHKRDPVWTRMDLKRSSSTNTHFEHNSVTFMQLPPHMMQHIPAANNHQLSFMAQNVDVHSHLALSERWIANKQRWSQCSGSTHSRSSTPDTIVWRDRTSRPSSLTLETSNCAAAHSPMSQPTSPPTRTYPFISPIQTPTSTPEDPLTSSVINLSTHQQEVFLLTHSLPPGSSPTLSPQLSPLHSQSASPMQSISTSTEDECFLENNSLSFTFPSPPPSSVSFAAEGVSSDLGYLTDGVIEELHSPEDAQLSEDGGLRSPTQMLSCLMPNSPTKEQEAGGPVCHLEPQWQLEQSCLTRRSWRSPLVCSISESQLGDCCRCVREGLTKTPQGVTFKEEGTMTSLLDLVDATVQTISPDGSMWGLMKNMSTSNMGSHSILGSPPGSRLNLKYSVGSHSNLVSPSSSMFPVSSGEEEDTQGEDQIRNSSPVFASSHYLERKRSCLKMQRDESDEMGRRSSMKQVQWDEDGMTWDIHGASPDLEVLSEAIQKHLEVQNSPRPARHSSKKKKAPKPPLLSNVVKTMTTELNPTVTITMPSCMVEAESEDTPEGGRKVSEEGGERKQETEESDQRISRAEGDNIKETEEVYGEEGTNNHKSPSRGSGQLRRKSVIRSLRRPGWCGGSSKAHD